MCVDPAIIRLHLGDIFRYAILYLFYFTLSDVYRISHRKLNDEPEKMEICHLDTNSYYLYFSVEFFHLSHSLSKPKARPASHLFLSKNWTITRSINFAPPFHIQFIPLKAFYPN